MEGANIQPNRVGNCCCGSWASGPTSVVFQKNMIMHENAKQPIPLQVTYQRLIAAYCNVGDIEGARYVFCKCGLLCSFLFMYLLCVCVCVFVYCVFVCA
jgi:pentatricopeptide repeat protein